MARSSWSELPKDSIKIKDSQRVSISDCVFNQTHAGALDIDNVEEVEIINNEFSIDILQALRLRNSPNLYISCNRLHDEEDNPECSRISSTLNIDVSNDSFSEDKNPIIIVSFADLKLDQHYMSEVDNFLWLLVIGSLVTIATILICFFFGRNMKRKATAHEYLCNQQDSPLIDGDTICKTGREEKI